MINSPFSANTNLKRTPTESLPEVLVSEDNKRKRSDEGRKITAAVN